MVGSIDLERCIEKEANYIEGRSEYSFDEAKGSLERGVRYYMDSGYGSDEAWYKAIELVATAMDRAGRCGFDLRGMVDYMLFSNHHRVQSSCGI